MLPQAVASASRGGASDDLYWSASEAILVAGLTYIGRHHDLDETTAREEQRLEGEIM